MKAHEFLAGFTILLITFAMGVWAGLSIAPVQVVERSSGGLELLQMLSGDTRNSTWTSTDGRPPPRLRLYLEPSK